MSLNEFELVDLYFKAQAQTSDSDVILGIGDDAALIQPPATGEVLAFSVDTLVADIHFHATDPAHAIGYKALAVNFSDLAAMGATPRYVLLALTLPTLDEAWLAEFCRGFFTLLKEHRAILIGGDITHGPLSITVQVTGTVPRTQALTRAGAHVGDVIYVTGTLGDAAAALTARGAQCGPLVQRLQYPTARINWGLALRGHAHAMIDISDGLLADLGHICEQSKVGARINVDRLPLSSVLRNEMDYASALNLALTGGDDYELCFTIAPTQADWLQQTAQTLNCPVQCIGEITAGSGIDLVTETGESWPEPTKSGYQHF
jgi:thiamine-monophosphate kinase